MGKSKWEEEAKLYAIELEMLEAGFVEVLKRHDGDSDTMILMCKVITNQKSLLEYAEEQAKENENE